MVLAKLVVSNKGVRTIFIALVASLPNIANIMAMMFLVLFTFSVLGMQFFANVKYGNELNAKANFATFDMSMLVLIRSMTGEAWNTIMHDLMVSPPYCQAQEQTINGEVRMGDCGWPAGAIVFFGLYFLVATYILLSLFVAVIVDNFAGVSMSEELIPESAIRSFKANWARFTVHSNPPFKYLAGHNLFSFLDCVEAPLGFKPKHYHGHSGQKKGAFKERKRYYDKVRKEIEVKGTYSFLLALNHNFVCN